jgi:hypothetical protein
MMSSAWVLVYLIPYFAAAFWIISFIYLFFTAATWTEAFPPQGPPTTGTTTTSQHILMPIFASIALFYVSLLISLIASIILIYKLVKRRNTHFKRQTFLFEDIITALKAIASKKGVDVEVKLSSCTRTVRETKAEETEKSAFLWAILSAIPWVGVLAGWYVYYFLMKDFYKHERREDGFWEDIRRTLDDCGVTFSVPRRTEALPERSFVLYLILNIITIGLFGIYWVYVLLKDPNQHFKYHAQIENQLLSSLESAVI